MTWLREAPTEVVDRTVIHEGLYECWRTACEVPGCGTELGECCSHCPAANRQWLALLVPGQRGPQ